MAPTEIANTTRSLVADPSFFGELDYQGFGVLAPVQNAVSRGDYAAARRGLADYYRTRLSPAWYIDPLNPQGLTFNQAAADKAEQGTVTVVGYTYSFPNGVIDWGYNATQHDPGVAPTGEWTFQLNRMYFWTNLAKARLLSNNTAYGKALAAQIRGWIDTQPRPTAGSPSNTWRTIEAGIRLSQSWAHTWYAFQTSPEFTDDTRISMLKSFLEQGQYLRAFLQQFAATNVWPSNWRIFELHGLFTVGSIFPEFKASKEWREFAGRGLTAAIDQQLLADGAQYELTPSYHWIVVESGRRIYEEAKLTGSASALGANFLAPIRRGYEYLIKIATPFGGVPEINDTFQLDVGVELTKATALFPNDPLLSWYLDRRQGRAPSYRSVFLPDAGLAVMRSGWGKDDHYALLDVGQLGKAHVHQDKLNLIVMPYGRRLLFDNGGGPYEQSVYRQWAVSTQAHNAVLVDGAGQARALTSADPHGHGDPSTPAPVALLGDPRFDYVVGSYQDAYGSTKPAKHRREVLFDRDQQTPFWIVVDTLTPNDAQIHSYQARWQLLTTSTQHDASLRSITTDDKGLPNLVIQPLSQLGLLVQADSATTSPEVLGWNLDHNSGQRTAATTVRHSRNGRGVQRFVTLLWPLRAGEANPISSVLAKGTDDWEVVFSDHSRLRVVLFAKGAPGILSAYFAQGKVVRQMSISPTSTVLSPTPADGGTAPSDGGSAGSDGGAPFADGAVSSRRDAEPDLQRRPAAADGGLGNRPRETDASSQSPEDPKQTSSGCAAGGRPTHVWHCALVLLLLSAARRRSRHP
ncbi:MAG: alginate lyase family protein [Deltaproteobacteria bacterium]|nr:alginate lyase family protein [Deltaproteobacteria bacterium]